ncbi:anti-phage ZorAB system protein ZorA [Vibrio spartinae]|uniref:Uncharacterized protein n=1 Tax=Vibrio spartinae TaxID=1918945 RepID=A0A1N6M7L1_9VIBR|nr:anti-phage ZorAB system protein ZorA [Vibrio spartinae]SIO95425.1 hypothetical protein VSP9026_03169 [Vibrio spartinae]
MNESLNFSSFFPFSSLTFPPTTSEGLSSVFVVLLIFLSVIFGFISIRAYLRARGRITSLKKLLKKTENNNVVDIRQDLIDELSPPKYAQIRHLWNEFDETLIEAIGRDGIVRLYNTYDAAYFFNSSTLAAGSTESRMLTAVPGFLTAVGVIGTFMGLQLGLADLNIGGNVGIDEMKNGVAGVISGAKIAFVTSVWGVTLSVIFNFVEKLFEYKIRRRLSDLQQIIDDLFPRLSTESQLERIAHDSHQSRESLQGLAEQIGDRLQDSLIQATQGIQNGLESSLEKIMAPAINKFVNETSDGNQKALEATLQAFMDGFGQQGEQQRLAMDSASNGVNASLDKMSTSMEAFLNRLQTQQDASSEREKDLISSISVQVSELVEQGTEQKRTLAELVDRQVTTLGQQFDDREKAAAQREEKLATSIETTIKDLVDNVSSQSQVLSNFVNEQIGSLTSSFNERDLKSQQMERDRNEVFVQQTDAMKQGTETLLSRVSDVSEANMKAAENILSQGKQLQASLDSSVSASARATESMQQSAKELRSASDNMQVFGSHIREAGNNLSGAVQQAVESTKDLAQQNQLSSDRIEQLRVKLLEDAAKFDSIAQTLDRTIINADSTFTALKESQSEFLQQQQSSLTKLSENIQNHVNELSSRMTSLLEDYAERANSQTSNHLTVWSQSVNDYATNMNLAVNALSSVVDEIQGKVSYAQ